MPVVFRRASARLFGALLAAVLVTSGLVAIGTPAHAEDAVGVSADSGTISGRVTDESGEPVANVMVEAMAFDVPGSDELGKGSGTDADGAFVISGLPAGQYKVHFDTDSALSSVFSEWWNDAATEETATILTVSSGSTSDASAQLASAGVISGTMTDSSGQPVAYGYVVAYRHDDASDTWETQTAASTDDDGAYRITGLPAGSYKVWYSGGWPTEIAPEWWGDQASQESATTITLAAGEVASGIDPQVDRGAAISGNVVDQHGTAVAGASVTVRAVDVPGHANTSWNTQTDDNGDYSLTALAAGTYSVAFQAGASPLSLIGQWWDHASDESTATVIPLEAGDALSGVDAQLAAGATITGTVVDGDGHPMSGVSVVAFAGDSASYPAESHADGSYRIANLPAGDYSLRFEARLDSHTTLTEWWNNAAGRATAMPLHLSAGGTADSTDVVLAESDHSVLESQTAGLSGVVTDEQGQPVKGALVTIARVGLGSDGVYTDASGAWTYGGLPAADYVVSFSFTRGAETVTEYWDDAVDFDSATVIPLTNGEQRTDIHAVLTLPALPQIDAATPTVTGTARVGETLKAVPGAWSAGAAFTYQWLVNGEPVPGANQATLVIAPEYLQKSITVSVTGSKDDFVGATRVSAASAPVVAGILTAPTPTVSGVVAVGAALTAVPGTWTTGTTLSYQWYASGAAISGATASKLTLSAAMRDKQISVRITGRHIGYSSVVKASASTAKVSTAGTPTVTGTARVGSTLTAAAGTWTASTVFTYQWLADGAAIAGATKSTFVATTAQDSKAISVRVTGKKTGYATVVKTSSSTLRVMRFSTPTISGAPGVGSALTAKPNTWSTGTALTYQWLAGGVAISGATAPTFTPGSAQRDKQISVRVTGRKAGTTSVAATSALTARVATASTPSISGTVMVGSTLTAKPNNWTAGTTFSYQWYADGAAISGATRSTFVPASAQRDKQLTVTVTGRKSGYGTFAKTSAKSPRVALTATPGISGSLVAGMTLTVRLGTWTPGTAFSYQWYANGAAISGATSSTLKLSGSQVGRSITIRVTGSKSGYQTIARVSAKTGAVSYPTRTTPIDVWTCPSWAPIKGNQSSMIYHMPGQRFYDATQPEECFGTESAAVAAGYRKSKV